MSSTLLVRAPRAAMRRMRAPLAPLPFLALLAAPALAQLPPPSPCASLEHRQFDFWLGEWEVRGPAGKVAGTNRITRVLDGSVRQLWESTNAAGEWQVTFDGKYTQLAPPRHRTESLARRTSE